MKLYILQNRGLADFSSNEVHGVYSTREKAEEAMKRIELPEPVLIDEINLDEDIE